MIYAFWKILLMDATCKLLLLAIHENLILEGFLEKNSIIPYILPNDYYIIYIAQTYFINVIYISSGVNLNITIYKKV